MKHADKQASAGQQGLHWLLRWWVVWQLGVAQRLSVSLHGQACVGWRASPAAQRRPAH